MGHWMAWNWQRSTCLCWCVLAGACRGQERASDAQELELHTDTGDCCLGGWKENPGPLGKSSILNHRGRHSASYDSWHSGCVGLERGFHFFCLSQNWLHSVILSVRPLKSCWQSHGLKLHLQLETCPVFLWESGRHGLAFWNRGVWELALGYMSLSSRCWYWIAGTFLVSSVTGSKLFFFSPGLPCWVNFG